ncbi:MAG: two-component regulator propeller domain-containing protein [Bacteroidota bacterium]
MVFSQEWSFQNFHNAKDFSNAEVRCILRDSLGFVWVGTQDGLNQLSGSRVKVHKSQRLNDNSLSDNAVYSMALGNDGLLWIGTEMGLNSYDVFQEKFTRYFYADSTGARHDANYILDVLPLENGDVLCASYFGLLKLDPRTSRFERIETPSIESDEYAIWNLYQDDNKFIWIACNDGLKICHVDSLNEVDNYYCYTQSLNAESIPSNFIWGIEREAKGNFWFASFSGLFRTKNLDIRNLRFDRISEQQEIPNNLVSYMVNALHIDQDNHLWVATYDDGLKHLDLNVFDENGIEFEHIRNRPFDNSSIASNEVISIYRDEQDILWVGSTGGLSKYDANRNFFQHVKHILNEPNSISENSVLSVLELSDGRMICGTKGEGLNIELQPGQTRFAQLDSSLYSSLGSNQINRIYEDKFGVIWICTYEGIYFTELEYLNADKWRKIDAQDGLCHNFVYDIFQQSDSVYWVATYGGLARMAFKAGDFQSPEFSIYESDDTNPRSHINSCTYTIAKDALDRMWFGTFNGISLYVPSQGSHRSYFRTFSESDSDLGLSNKSINHLYRDRENRLWAATANGLNFIEIKEQDEINFISFGIEEGLPNSYIASIAEDDRGFFWLSTSKGIVVIDPTAALAQREFVLAHYTQEEGLQSNQFFDRSSYSSGKRLFFGGANGINICNTESIRELKDAPAVIITDLFLNGERAVPHSKIEGNEVLEESILLTRQLDLDWDMNNIEFVVSCTNQKLPEKNEIFWTLNKSNWMLSNSGNIQFNNLKPGTYLFEAKARNAGGVFSNQSLAMQFDIAAPPWKTPLAYFIYFLILTGALYYVLSIKMRRRLHAIKEEKKLREIRELERLALRAKTAQDFHDELGHNLTKISLYSKLIQDDQNRNTQSLIKKIDLNLKELSSGVRDFIWTFDPQLDNLEAIVLRIQDFGNKLFEDTEVSFKTVGLKSRYAEIELNPDRKRQLVLIFKESLNNIVKHARANEVLLSISEVNSHAIIKLEDNGLGFDPDKNERGYGLKNIRERAEKHGMKAFIESIEEKGTSISIHVPLND